MKSLLRLLPYFKRYKWLFIRGAVLVVLSTTCETLWPKFLGRAIDNLKAGNIPSDFILRDALIIVGLTILSGYFFYLVRQTIIVASRKMEYDLRNDLLAHIEKLSTRFFQNTPQGEIMAYATNDIDAVRSFIGPAVMYSANTLATFIFAMSFMLRLSPLVALATVVPLPLMSLGVYLIGRKVNPLFEAVQKHYADLTARTTESMSGLRLVRAYVREEYEEGVFDTMSNGYFQRNMRLIRVQGLMMPIIFTFMGLSVISLLVVAGPRIMDGRMSIGQLAQFLIYLGMLTWPFIALGWVTNMIQRSAASMVRLARLMDMVPEIKDEEPPSPHAANWSINAISGAIEFDNVTFRYRPELEPALKNIRLTIPAGSTLAVIGRTGSGKTSLVNLMARLYEPTEGTLLVDGNDIRTIPLHVLRGGIGLVTQEAFLFSETIEENIAFGISVTNAQREMLPKTSSYDAMPDASNRTLIETTMPPAEKRERVLEAAKLADIYDNIMEFPKQFETMIGERGITLSGGQKQRTSLARAIARRPKILILDDAMSAVDTATEERILRSLRSLEGQHTTILISHRVSTAKNADHIIVLDQGEIIEAGTHEDLLNQRGAYHDLHRRQLLEEALENA